MDKNQLLTVLSNSIAPTAEDAHALIALKNKYPYSQVCRIIAAKASADFNFDNHNTLLQEAAVYAADRAVLKEVMAGFFEEPDADVFQEEVLMDIAVQNAGQPLTADNVESPLSFNTTVSVDSSAKAPVEKPLEVSPTVQTDVQDTTSHPVVNENELPPAEVVSKNTVTRIETPPVPVDGFEKMADQTDVAEAVMRDLEKLSELKHNFEMLFVDIQAIADIGPAEPPEEESYQSKSKRARIIELAKAMASPGPSDNLSPRKKRKDHFEIIDEIKDSKEEIIPESDRQKEQIEIIDHFIKVQPSITSVKDRNPLPATDLNSIKSGEFGTNIVSETLVDILIKQGKKERAIEVLKKLIWKYPQKKAYFASRIEDLKK